MTSKILTVAAALVVALTIGAPVLADCGANPATISSDGPGGTSLIWTRAFQNDPTFFYGSFGGTTYCGAYNGCTPLSPAATGSFWRLGAGDPAIGQGNDSGLFDFVQGDNTLVGGSYPSYGYYGGLILNTGWAAGLTDGCVDGGNCLCVLFVDHDADDTYIAVASGRASPALVQTIERGGTDGSGLYAAPIVLEPVGAPQINSSARNGTGVDLVVSAGAAGASYQKDSCDCSPVGYKVVQQIVARNSGAPVDRNVGAWSNASPVTPLGMPANVNAPCSATDSDVYLATQLVFDSGFEANLVGRNSTRIECGTTLADPDEKPATIRPTGPKQRPLRETPRGGR
jgi:hypothetical protein